MLLIMKYKEFVVDLQLKSQSMLGEILLITYSGI
jgi:hypothetical protein